MIHRIPTQSDFDHTVYHLHRFLATLYQRVIQEELAMLGLLQILAYVVLAYISIWNVSKSEVQCM